MGNPVMIDDLEARFRPLVGIERTVATALLADAWAIANAQLPTLATSLDGGGVPVETVRAVISAMVVRVLRNPEGLKQWSIDDGSFTRDSSVSGGTLYLTADELTLISASLGNRRRGAFSIAPGGEPERHSRGSEYGYGYRNPDWYGEDGYRW